MMYIFLCFILDLLLSYNIFYSLRLILHMTLHYLGNMLFVMLLDPGIKLLMLLDQRRVTLFIF